MSVLPDLVRLSLEEKVAQLIFPRLGSNIPPRVRADDDFERVAALLDRLPFGGLIVFNGSAGTTPEVLRRLQHRSRFPLLVATDMEAGVGQQFEGATLFPHAMSFSRTGADAEEHVRTAARIAAREALALGVHIAFAPVADVHRNRQNPIISIRAFSSDPEEAGRLAAAYVDAAREEGLLTTAKHFPGHGGTSDDSHATLPVVNDNRGTLDRTDLYPFRACIAAGVDLVMTAHVAFPAFDPELRPATLSPPILKDLLRGQLGFEGVVISDSMMMAGVRQRDGSPDAKLLMAGVDVLLDPVDPVQAVEAIVAAVHAGAVDPSALDAAVARVNALKSRLLKRHGSRVFAAPDEVFADVIPGAAAHQEVARRIASSALTCSDPGHPLLGRLIDRATSATVGIFPSPRSLPLAGTLVEAVRVLAPHANVVVVEPDANVAGSIAAMQEPDVFVAAVMIRPAAWHAYGLTTTQEDALRQASSTWPTVLGVLGSEDLVDRLPRASVTVCTHSDMPPSLEALAAFLFGRRDR